MPARVMLSSVTKDDLLPGDTGKLKDFWYQSETLPVRLQQKGWMETAVYSSVRLADELKPF